MNKKDKRHVYQKSIDLMRKEDALQYLKHYFELLIFTI